MTDRIKDALIAARDRIRLDRTALAEALHEGQAGLDDYDAVLEQIDAAMKEHQ